MAPTHTALGPARSHNRRQTHPTISPSPAPPTSPISFPRLLPPPLPAYPSPAPLSDLNLPSPALSGHPCHLTPSGPASTISATPSLRAGAPHAPAPAPTSRAPPSTIFEEELHFVRVHSTRAPDREATTIHPPFPDDDISDSDTGSAPPTPDNHRLLLRHSKQFAKARASIGERRLPFSKRPPPHPANNSAAAPPPTHLRARPPLVGDDSPPSDIDEDDDDDDAATNVTAATDHSFSTRSSGSRRRRAKMAAKVVSKPIKKSYVGMVAGLASTVGLGQAMFLKATYQSPPDARGPRSGVERPVARLNTQTLSSSEGHVTRILTASDGTRASNHAGAAGASVSTQSAVNDAVDAAVESVRAQLGNIDLSPTVEKHGSETVTKHKRILIIGDSLVSGVGGLSSFEDGPSDGPALPRQVARYLSEMLNVDVQWNALSLTGGDVRMLKRKIVPMLTREKERGTIGDISAVVLVTGVNDWKRISPIRTANKFREDLAEFVVKIREQLGEDVCVFLPAIPGVHHTPRFHEPLRSIVIFLNDYWDSQKLQLSRSMAGVYFVGQPPNHEWGTNPVQFFSTLDRVHPSELGYDRWAERIAEHMVSAFEKISSTAKETVVKASMSASSTLAKATTSASSVVANATQRAAGAASRAVQVTQKSTEAVRHIASKSNNGTAVPMTADALGGVKPSEQNKSPSS